MLPFLLPFLLLLGLSGLLFRQRQRLKQQLLAIKGTEVANLSDLRQLVDHVAAEMGPGAYRERVALVGTVRCDLPLAAPLSKRACVYCQTVVKEKYQDNTTTTDSSGNRKRRSQRRTRVVSRDVIQTPFYLEDPSGQVRIDPDSFTIEGVTVVKRFEPASPAGTGLGSGLGRKMRLRRAHPRTLGYHYREDILPLGSSVYVMGELTDDGPELAVVAPAEAPAGILTHRSRQALLGQKEQGVRRRTVAIAVLLTTAVGLLLFGVYSLLG